MVEIARIRGLCVTVSTLILMMPFASNTPVHATSGSGDDHQTSKTERTGAAAGGCPSPDKTSQSDEYEPGPTNLVMLRNISLRGTRCMNESAVRHALICDPVLRDAMQSAGYGLNESAFCRLVASRIRAGYLHHGFVNADVKVVMEHPGVAESGADPESRSSASGTEEFLAPALIAEIQEGSRQTCGTVRVDFLHAADSDLIDTDELTSGESDKGSPDELTRRNRSRNDAPLTGIWKHGDPVVDIEDKVKKASDAIRRWFESKGYEFAEFTVHSEMNAETLQTTLVVKISDPGTRLRVTELIVSGNRRHSDEDVIRCLQLKLPVVCDESLRQYVRSRLEDSGRFRSVQVRSDVPFDRHHEDVCLYIDVVETSVVPILGEPLTDLQSALVGSGVWLKDFANQSEDLRVEMEIDLSSWLQFVATEDTGSKIRPLNLQDLIMLCVLGSRQVRHVQCTAIVSPGRGVALEFKGILADGRTTPVRRILAESDRLIVSVEGRGNCWMNVRQRSGVRIDLALREKPGGEKPDETAFDMSFGISSEVPSPLDLRIACPPALLIDSVMKDKTVAGSVKLTENRITITPNHTEVVLDRNSGHLVEAKIRHPSATISVNTASRIFEKAVEETQQRISGQTNTATDGAPVISLTRFLLDELIEGLTFDGLTADAGLLSVFVRTPDTDELHQTLIDAGSAHGFRIPGNSGETAISSVHEHASQVMNAADVTLSFASKSRTMAQSATTPNLIHELSEIQILAAFHRVMKDWKAGYSVARYLISRIHALDSDQCTRLVGHFRSTPLTAFVTADQLQSVISLIRLHRGKTPDETFDAVFPLVWVLIPRDGIILHCASLTGGGPDGTMPVVSVHFQYGNPQNQVKPVSAFRALQGTVPRKHSGKP